MKIGSPTTYGSPTSVPPNNSLENDIFCFVSGRYYKEKSVSGSSGVNRRGIDGGGRLAGKIIRKRRATFRMNNIHYTLKQ